MSFAFLTARAENFLADGGENPREIIDVKSIKY